MHLAVLVGSKDVLKLLNSAGANMSAQVRQHSKLLLDKMVRRFIL